MAEKRDITQVPMAELEGVRKALAQEVNSLTTAIKSLKHAQGKFANSKTAISSITPHTEGKASLVPLTESLYVQGEIADPSRVLIDVGTGYFIEMSKDRALDYFDRKIEYVTTQMKGLQSLALQKQKEQDAVASVYRQRMAQTQGATA
eukprot:m.33428 g.33428  ORF g.33428 m.33428 type:complete len:148 (-) comp6449_c0_seq1:2155-2598(-)